MADIKSLYARLSKEWQAAPKKDLKKIGDTIEELKIAFLEADFMPTDSSQQMKTDMLVIQRDTLEISALHAIELENPDVTFPAFERAMSQLKHYYALNSVSSAVGDSARKNMMLGLNLMAHLAQHRLAQFHMELELLPIEVVTKDPYVSLPVQLEQLLVEGTYNKIFLLKANLPATYYKFFIDILIETVRTEISNCISVSYPRVSISEAARLLFFTGNDASAQVKQFAKKNGWRTEKDQFVFKDLSGAKLDDKTIPAVDLAKQGIFYARQLEMIV